MTRLLWMVVAAAAVAATVTVVEPDQAIAWLREVGLLQAPAPAPAPAAPAPRIVRQPQGQPGEVVSVEDRQRLSDLIDRSRKR